MTRDNEKFYTSHAVALPDRIQRNMATHYNHFQHNDRLLNLAPPSTADCSMCPISPQPGRQQIRRPVSLF
jgi:hypothetical protein